MAPVPATLKISFTSNYYPGTHIVCYRIAGSGDPYTCLPVSCGSYIPPALPVPCFLDIPVLLDNSTCNQVSYEGYVYPTCATTQQEILDSQTTFFVTFTPVQPCNLYTMTCTGGGACNSFSIPSCNGTLTIPGNTVVNGYVVKSCLPTDPTGTLPPDWAVVAEPDCCYTCSAIEFTNTDAFNSYAGGYVDCSTGNTASTGLIPPLGTITVCGVTNSGFVENPAVTFTDTPGCP